MRPITERQRYVLRVIHGAGETPSLSELGAALGISMRGAHDHVLALERKGLITRRRAAGSAVERAITLTAKGFEAIGVSASSVEDDITRMKSLLTRAFEALRSASSAAPLVEDIRKEIAT